MYFVTLNITRECELTCSFFPHDLLFPQVSFSYCVIAWFREREWWWKFINPISKVKVEQGIWCNICNVHISCKKMVQLSTFFILKKEIKRKKTKNDNITRYTNYYYRVGKILWHGHGSSISIGYFRGTSGGTKNIFGTYFAGRRRHMGMGIVYMLYPVLFLEMTWIDFYWEMVCRVMLRIFFKGK